MSKYDITRCMVLMFIFILGGCATVPPIPSDPGVIIPRSPTLTFDAALNALKAEGIDDIFQQKKPLYIQAASPMRKMGQRVSGDKVWELEGRSVLVDMWFEALGANSTRVVIKGYLFTSEKVKERILAKMRSLLGVEG